MRQINLRVSEELLGRVDLARGDVPRERWLRGVVERALASASGVAPAEQAAVGQALSEAKEPLVSEQADPGSVSSLEGVRSAAPAGQSLSRTELFRRAAEKR